MIVDVQPTFCEDGELAVDGGNELAKKIARYLKANRKKYKYIVTTQDWHIAPGAHFSATPDFARTWPVHAMAGSPGAELHPALSQVNADYSIKKGQYDAAYSGFEGTDQIGRSLADVLNNVGVGALDVVGIAESHCVAATAIDGVKEGFSVRVLTDLTIPVSPKLGEAARQLMTKAGVELVSSQEL